MARGSGVVARRIICTGETYKNAVKMTFAKGASLDDPSGLFNSSLEGNTRRAIDFHEGDKIDEDGVEGAHSRRRGAEHFDASCRWPRPFAEKTKERLTWSDCASLTIFGSNAGPLAYKPHLPPDTGARRPC